jgi:DNA invertase Pin-like site-specific DNA recombinase
MDNISTFGRGHNGGPALPPLYISYIRWSTPEQSFGDSERRQIENGRRWAADLGAEYLDEYRDAGVQASRGKNRKKGDLGRLIADVKARKYGDRQVYIGVESIDRLSREIMIGDDPQAGALRLFLQLMDMRLYPVIRGQLVTHDFLRQQPSYWHQIIGEMNRAAEETERKSNRLIETNAAKRANALAGNHLFGGHRCPGFLRPNAAYRPGRGNMGGQYEYVPERKPIVERMIAECLRGIGAPTIANRLNDENVPPFDQRKRKKGDGGWYPGSVLHILKNPALFGQWQPHRYIDSKRVKDGDPKDDYFPALIDRDKFALIQATLKGRRMSGGRRGKRYANLFEGLGQCSCPACNAGLIRDEKSPTLAYLRCSKSKRRKCDMRASMPYAGFEAAMLDLMGVGMQQMIAAIIAPPDDDQAALSVCEAAVAGGEARIADLFERFGSSSVAAIRDGAAKQIEQIGIELEANKVRLARLREDTRMTRYMIADDGFLSRVVEAKAKLNSPDERTRYDARAALAQEFRRHIEAIVLNPDRSVVVKIKSYGQMNRAEVVVTVEGTTAAQTVAVNTVRVLAQDGAILTEFERAGLALLEPIASAETRDALKHRESAT